MDKRIIWFALIVILVVASILFFRNGCGHKKPGDGKPKTLHFSIDKPTITVGDSIYFEDNTEGATSWYWEFGDGSSKQQKGYNLYYESGQYTIRLTVNGVWTDSAYITVNPKDDPIVDQDRVIISGPRAGIVFVREPVTFTDNTPGAQHTNWQNMVTNEKKLDSKTYTTTFTQKGNFTIIATNEKNTKGSNGQGIISGKIIDRRVPPPSPPTVKCDICGKPHATKDHKNPPPPPPPPPPGKQNPNNEQLKAWFIAIATDKSKSYSVNYKPVKDALGDETLTIEVITKGSNARREMPLSSFCYQLKFLEQKVLNVESNWNQTDGFKSIKVIVEDK